MYLYYFEGSLEGGWKRDLVTTDGHRNVLRLWEQALGACFRQLPNNPNYLGTV